MSLLNQLNIRQRIAAAGLSVVALAGLGATGHSYLEKTKAHSAKGAHVSNKELPSSDEEPTTVRTKTGSRSAKSRPAYGSVNLNTATEQELDTLPGVGPSTAAKIVEYRAAHNGFTSVDELDQVKGIGPKKLEEMRPYCRL